MFIISAQEKNQQILGSAKKGKSAGGRLKPEVLSPGGNLMEAQIQLLHLPGILP